MPSIRCSLFDHYTYLPCEKGAAFYFYEPKLLLPNDAFLPSLIKICPVVLEKKMMSSYYAKMLGSSLKQTSFIKACFLTIIDEIDPVVSFFCYLLIFLDKRFSPLFE